MSEAACVFFDDTQAAFSFIGKNPQENAALQLEIILPFPLVIVSHNLFPNRSPCDGDRHRAKGRGRV